CRAGPWVRPWVADRVAPAADKAGPAAGTVALGAGKVAPAADTPVAGRRSPREARRKWAALPVAWGRVPAACARGPCHRRRSLHRGAGPRAAERRSRVLPAVVDTPGPHRVGADSPAVAWVCPSPRAQAGILRVWVRS